ncbi:hypothetical protein mRhiFer1_009015 [Rhinolophus ferrumequinum]|uniref:Uncharacterized protein n=1 Tax=Rhinolophus ferrumequinum TaxID=59479 RepID=A0A7J7SXY3_RHIFE|nr:hypothetical protein mRhiFer1_009015 [Rhinolophus ferrumequinum]
MNGLEPSGPGRSLGLTRWGAFLPASSEAPLPALLTTQMFFLGCRPVRLPGGVPTPFSETLLGQNLGGLQATSLSCDLCGQAGSALTQRFPALGRGAACWYSPTLAHSGIISHTKKHGPPIQGARGRLFLVVFLKSSHRA